MVANSLNLFDEMANSVFINEVSQESLHRLRNEHGVFYRVGVSVPKTVSDSGYVNFYCNDRNIIDHGRYVNLVFNKSAKNHVSYIKNGEILYSDAKMSDIAKYHEAKLNEYQQSISKASQKGGIIVNLVQSDIQYM